MFKEDRIPGHVQPFYYTLAPLVSLIPAFMTFAVIPVAEPLQIGERTITFSAANLDVGILYVFAIASLGVYGIIMAGWASNNKYAMLGSLRSSSQMISYELSMGLSVVSLIMLYSSVKLGDIAAGQAAMMKWVIPGLGIALEIPKWGVFIQPLSCVIFVTAAFAETNRLPFDLPEGESEIVAGYHLEYGSMKFAMLMMAEYINMFTASGLIATLYFGGYQFLPGMASAHEFLVAQFALQGMEADILRVVFQVIAFATKVAFFMWFFVWVRWTLPRFRYDQLMDLGWKVMLPLSLLNIFVTGYFIASS
jgi:NADH-quinone oxidoreductase subunit H